MRHKAAILIAVLLAAALPFDGAAAVMDFDSLSEGDAVTTQYSGLVFTHATVLTAGISLNEFEFPARSGSNVVSDTGGPIDITFLFPTVAFRGYFTYLVPLKIRAFDASDNEVASVTSSFSNNLALSGEAGSSPNELLQVAFATGISRVLISGGAAGGSFTLDNATTDPVPEPGTLALLLSGAAGILVLRRSR